MSDLIEKLRKAMECPYCKNTGQHMCPDVAEPILVNCSFKYCHAKIDQALVELVAAAEEVVAWARHAHMLAGPMGKTNRVLANLNVAVEEALK